ncbi:MAG: hemin uptake protein HemP [Zoogloeaceae bacterium]|nr:hemin uptake protein HemP [Zoogloeaceae bacterium]
MSLMLLPATTADDTATKSCAKPHCLDSRQIFHDGLKHVEISHAGMRYLLSITQHNKLILTKI